jgi:hypothetical protein
LIMFIAATAGWSLSNYCITANYIDIQITYSCSQTSVCSFSWSGPDILRLSL